MATYYSDVLTNRDANPPVMNEFNRVGGRLKMAYSTYTMGSSAATEVGTDIVHMSPLPKGSIVWPHLSYIWWTDCGGTITVDVGTDADRDRYCSDLAMGTASTALTLLTEAAVMNASALAFECTAVDCVILTFDVVTTPNTTGIIYLATVYTQNG